MFMDRVRFPQNAFCAKYFPSVALRGSKAELRGAWKTSHFFICRKSCFLSTLDKEYRNMPYYTHHTIGYRRRTPAHYRLVRTHAYNLYSATAACLAAACQREGHLHNPSSIRHAAVHVDALARFARTSAVYVWVFSGLFRGWQGSGERSPPKGMQGDSMDTIARRLA